MDWNDIEWLRSTVLSNAGEVYWKDIDNKVHLVLDLKNVDGEPGAILEVMSGFKYVSLYTCGLGDFVVMMPLQYEDGTKLILG
jgi:hypothetical protein